MNIKLSFDFFSRTSCLKHFSYYNARILVFTQSTRSSFKILMKPESSRQRKILKHQISRQSVQWESSCSMRTDGKTEMAKLIVAFRNFMNAPKNCAHISVPQNLSRGYAVACWLKHCATSRKVAGSTPDGVTGIFLWHNPSGPHRGSEVDSASNRNEYQVYFSSGVKAADA
jgi:hypothetical protein